MERKSKITKTGSLKSVTGDSHSERKNPGAIKQTPSPKKKSASRVFQNLSSKGDNPTTEHQKSTEEKIRERAHQIFLDNGSISGSEIENWLQAEREMNEETDE